MRVGSLNLRQQLCSWLHCVNGATAITFGLAMIPLTLALGALVDYGIESSRRNALQSATDVAALTVAKANPSTSTAAQALAQQIVQSNFNANAAPTVVVTQPSAGVWQVSATAPVSTSIMKIVGVSSVKLGATSQATVGVSAGTYIDFYILADVSDSMGLGASPADQSLMESQMGCAFGCHEAGSDATARGFGATLRIDAVKTALQDMVTTAQSAMTQNPNLHVRFSIVAFANGFQTLIPISSNFGAKTDTTTSSVFGAINSLDLEYGGLGSSTATPYVLNNLAQTIPASGDGTTAASPVTYAVLASDGVADTYTVDNTAPAGRVVSSLWSGFLPAGYVGSNGELNSSGISPAVAAGITCPNYLTLENDTSDSNPASLFSSLPTPCLVEPNSLTYPSTSDYAAEGASTAYDQMYMTPVDPNWCAPLKSSGVNMVTVYTTYYLPGPNSPVNNAGMAYIKYAKYAVAPNIASAMAACASSTSLAYTASDTASIDASFQSLFAQAVAQSSLPLRLVK